MQKNDFADCCVQILILLIDNCKLQILLINMSKYLRVQQFADQYVPNTDFAKGKIQKTDFSDSPE